MPKQKPKVEDFPTKLYATVMLQIGDWLRIIQYLESRLEQTGRDLAFKIREDIVFDLTEYHKANNQRIEAMGLPAAREKKGAT